MVKEKTVILSGVEKEVSLSGCNCDIRNDGISTVYISRSPGIQEDADGVMSVPAGQAVKYIGISGSVYLLGSGKVQLCGNDYIESVFNITAASSGDGGTIDQTARDAINLHESNSDIHTSLSSAAALFSNPSLLVNGDFAINQRGQTEYTADGYTLDRWRLYRSGTAGAGEISVKKTAAGIKIDNKTNGGIVLYQRIERYTDLFGKEITASAEINGEILSVTGTPEETTGVQMSVTRNWGSLRYFTNTSTGCGEIEILVSSNMTAEVKWVKLETCPCATAFTPADPALELVRCQRYYQIRSSGDVNAVDLSPAMCSTPVVTQLESDRYAYSAEL